MQSLTLDALDRQLVHALAVDGRVSFGRLADVLGASDRTLARRYRRLRAAGALRVVAVPAARALGQSDWMIRMRAAPHAAAGIASVLAARADTSWVALASGGAEITCRTRAPTMDALVLPSLPRSPRIDTVTAQRVLRGVAGVHGWPARIAALSAEQVEALRLDPDSDVPGGRDPGGPAPVALTDADRALLAPLGRDGRVGYAALATATGWSPSAVARRVAELRRSGALSWQVDVEPALFGAPQGAQMWLTVRPAALADAGRALARHPDVAFAAVTTGPTNLIAFIACADDDALHDDVLLPIGRIEGVLHVDLSPIARQVSRSAPVPHAPAPQGAATPVPRMAP